MRSLLGGAKLPKMDVLKEEGRKLTAKKKQLYGEYQKARRDMQEIVTIKANIDTLMGYTEPEMCIRDSDEGSTAPRLGQ